MPISPRKLVSYWSLNDPDRVAILTDSDPVTYAMLHQHVSRLAAALEQNGIKAGSQVGLSFPNSTDFIIWLFAVFKCNAVACPINPQLSTNEARSLLDAGNIDYFAGHHCEPVDDWCLLASPDSLGGQLYHRDISVTQPKVTSDPSIVLRQFTSGSAGLARHILRSEQQLAEDYGHFCSHLGLCQSDRFLCIAPFFHAYGALGLFACLSVGATLIQLSRFIPGETLATARKHQPTVFLATPPMIELLGKCQLDRNDDTAFDSLKYCICSTAKLKDAARRQFTQRYGKPISIQYGSTETLGTSIDLDDNFSEDNVGKPYPGVSIQIFGNQGELLDPGETGAIGISSPASCTSYVDEGPPMARHGSYILPGDRGYLDPDGRLHAVGRDDQINIGGYKVDRLEVGNVISSYVHVTYVSILPYNRAGQQSLRAIIEADPEKVTADMVITVCKKHLVQYKVPSRVDIYASVPRDANGKVLASTLKDLR